MKFTAIALLSIFGAASAGTPQLSVRVMTLFLYALIDDMKNAEFRESSISNI